MPDQTIIFIVFISFFGTIFALLICIRLFLYCLHRMHLSILKSKQQQQIVMVENPAYNDFSLGVQSNVV